MNGVEWEEINLELVLFFGGLILLGIIIVYFVNPRGRKRSFIALIIGISNLSLFLVPAPYHILFLIGIIVPVFILLNGKDLEALTTKQSEILFINAETPVWDQFEVPPESKKWQETHQEEIINE